MERITSRKNPLLEHMRRLDGAAYRRAQGEFLCDSPKLVEEALRHGAQLVSLAVSAGVTLPQGLAPDVRCVTVPKDVMTSVSSMRTPQGMLAVCRMPDTALPEVLAGQRYVVLDGVQDPGNVGTLCRTLYALGGAGVILPRHNSAYLGPAAHRAAAGALERLPVARVTNLAHALDEAEEAGFSIYGAGCGPDAADAFEHAMQLPAVLVLGNEDKGLRPGVAKRCGRMLRIPLARKFDSLNVAQAGAILLGLAAMRRQG